MPEPCESVGSKALIFSSIYRPWFPCAKKGRQRVEKTFHSFREGGH